VLKDRLIPTKTLEEEAFKAYDVTTITGNVTIQLSLGTFLYIGCQWETICYLP